MELWAKIDRYLDDQLMAADAALGAALAAADTAGIAAQHVAANQGKLLHLLARLMGARAILEIGTLAGYSTIWLARALPPGGRLITLEADPKHAEIARANIARAGLSALVELRLGRALDVLPQLHAAGRGPFDLIFIDADKGSNPDYLAWTMKLARRGSLIIADNVVRAGAVLDETAKNGSVRGLRRFLAMLGADPRVSATAIQTVGSKGHDGFAIALVIADL